MPTYNVTTWSELVSALSQGQPDDVNTVINLMNDIDMNGVAPMGVSTTQIKCYGRSMVLNGNGHYIKNLRTHISNPQPIFSMTDYHYLPTKALNIQNLDFVNLICAGSDFLYDSSDYRPVNFTNCRFVGCRTGNAYLINQSSKISCTSCYFDMPWYGAGSSSYDYCALTPTDTNPNSSTLSKANYCWFHESYAGWYILNSTTSSNIQPQSSVATTQCARFAMSGCYIDGSMKRSCYWTESGASIKNVYAYCDVYYKSLSSYFTSSTPNVVDMHWYVDKKSQLGSGYNYVYAVNMSGLFKKDVTFSDADASSWNRTTASPQPNVTFATATQMQNVEWLRSQGFPIIVPTT